MTADDMLSPEALVEPECYFAGLREHDPIHWSEKRKMWILTRYEDVVWVARQPQLFSSDKLGFNVRALPENDREGYRQRYAAIFSTYPIWLSATDNPLHDHIRLIVNQVWTPGQAEKRRLKIRKFIHDLLDEAEKKSEIDFIKDFTLPLPIKVILDYLDFPHEDWEEIKEYSDRWLTYHFGGGNDPERWQSGVDGIKGLTDYVTPRVKERRANPTDDYISALIKSEWKGDRLTDEEIIVHCANLLFAGHETTTNLLANGLHLLMTHRDQWDRICKDPSLIPLAVEEIVRMEGAIKSMLRYALEDVEIKGKTIRKGDLVLLVAAAANRDSAKYTDPQKVDVGRRPNPHLGFGQGIHICLGAPLARLEGHETYLALSQRFPGMRLATDKFEYHAIMRGRALKALPVTLK
ncbi:MAG TPA: cytochrome P450 [Pseudolabrys sp.]|nr:cytochrome P450 [Pseudolabrys sp.]